VPNDLHLVVDVWAGELDPSRRQSERATIIVFEGREDIDLVVARLRGPDPRGTELAEEGNENAADQKGNDVTLEEVDVHQ
jgi:hypothetical protein